MNNERRKALEGIVADLALIKGEVEALTETPVENEDLADKEEAWSGQVETAHTSLEECRDEEQEYLDNMPESFRNSDRGSNSETAISAMQEGMDALDELMNVEEVGEFIKICENQLDTAIAQIEEAQA
jgi:hypothetical protein